MEQFEGGAVSSKQQLILFALIGLVIFRFFKSGGWTLVSTSLSGGSIFSSGNSFNNSPNGPNNPTAKSNGALPGGSYPGLVQPGSPGSATNPNLGI